ncbi:hypothetical protein A4G20_03385 [Pasteurellaceae bacterium RH1A]|nr:hypothetical protein A4G20_03385 [Pasteurellaceae bacterium RH1A]
MEERVLPKPTIQEVEKYLAQWDTFENYTLQEKALNKLFFELSPENKDVSDILIKASSLNDFYSTNIFSIYPVAKHILGIKNLDKRLKAGDESLVNELAKITIGEKKKNFYSFATKYCSHHNPEVFPIYDSYVEKVLCYFNKGKEDKFSIFKRSELKDYSTFKAVLLDFQKYFGLEKFNLKELDRYLWLLGKEYFPRDNKKN